MAKSRTRKKYAKKPSVVIPQEITSIATDYLKQWTSKELTRIQSKEVLCVPSRTGYKIGLYQLILNPNKSCDVLNHNQEFVHRFENKISAILYTIYTIKHKYWVADEILHWDQEINKNYTDTVALRRTIEEAKRRKDYFSVDIRLARLEIAETKLNRARDKILKIHKTGKYNKVWE